MRKVIFFALIAIVILLMAQGVVPVSAQDSSARDIVGDWTGMLDVIGGQLRIVFHFVRGSDGSLTTTMDKPDQGIFGIPVERTTFLMNFDLHLEITAEQALYNGVMNMSGTEINGFWIQHGVTPLNLIRGTDITQIARPQYPQAPLPYGTEEVAYANQSAGIELAGTLTIPAGEGPFPAAILITGSGALDRDETMMGHKPFLVIADYLTRRGIAVLRVDDRGVGGSTGDTNASTSLDFAGDVLSGVQYLKGRPEIDPARIGLIGHSEGGLIAPLAATRSKDIAYIVLLAGPGLKGDEITRRQNELMLKAAGGTDAQLVRQTAYLDRLFAVARTTDPQKAEKDIQDLAAWLYNEMSSDERMVYASNVRFIALAIKQIINPWFRFFIDYDPAPTLKKVACPVLAMNGSKDLQVPAKEDLAAIAGALKEGGNPDYTVLELPGLNHMLQHCETGLPAEYPKINETFAPEALQAMGDWILKRMTE